MPPETPAACAGIARRFGSMAYEALLLTAILFVCTWIFLFFAQALSAALVRPLLQVLLVTITGAYFIYCWTHGGQTLPMKTWRIRLVMRDGKAVSRTVAIKRYLLALLSIGGCGLGFAWALFDAERQFLHDRIAGTRLIVPIERPDGPPVLIDRGWVPAEPRTPIDMPDGTTTVVGFVRPAEHAGWFGVPDNPVERKFYTLDPLAIGKALGLARTEPFVIVAMGATPAAGFPDPAHAMPRPPNNHLSYVATWYGLAIVFVAIYGLWLRRRLKDAD